MGEVGRAEQGAARIRQDLQLVPPVLLALPVSLALRCWQGALCSPFSEFDTMSEGQAAVGTQMNLPRMAREAKPAFLYLFIQIESLFESLT